MNRFHLPYLGYGLGLRAKHYPYILEHLPKEVQWFEIITENFIETDGRPKRVLGQVAAHYPMVMHGVSLSIGSTDPLNRDYLHKLKTLAECLKPAWISDHLCWTGINGVNTHDLLPLPYTEAMLAHVVERIKQVQDVLGRPLLIENPSSYVNFMDNTMPEWEFLARMAEDADCALLLDVNNVFVSCFNHLLDTKAYIDALPLDRVVQIHLAGHRDCGSHRIDTHDTPVQGDVWAMYRYVISKAGLISTMIEWDDAIPEFPVLLAELNKAKHHASVAQRENTMPYFGEFMPQASALGGAYVMAHLQEAILAPEKAQPFTWAVGREDFTAAQQVAVYQDGYHYRLYDLLYDAYPALRAYLGDDVFHAMIQEYIQLYTPNHVTMNPYGDDLPEMVAKQCDVCATAIVSVEHALDRLFDASESIPLITLDEEGVMAQVVGLRTASRLFAFPVAVYDFIQHVIAGEEGGAPVISVQPQYMVVYRHADVMRRMMLEEKEYHALKLLVLPQSMEAFFGALDESITEAQVQTWFSRWISNGLLANFSV